MVINICTKNRKNVVPIYGKLAFSMDNTAKIMYIIF